MNQFKLLLTSTMLLYFSCNNPAQDKEKEQDPLMHVANVLAHSYIIADGHVDLPYRLNIKMEDVSQRTEDGNFDYIRAKEGGLDAPFMSIFIPASYQKKSGAKKLADSLIDMVVKITTDHPEKFALAYSTADVEKNFNEEKISLPLGMENGAGIEDSLANIQYFYDRGIRYITLTHGKDNLICDSSYDTARTHNGLSDFGRNVVAEMNRVGIMVDVSHISDSTFYQVMEISKAPVIASHSSCRHFTPGFERNMSDEMIKLLASKGGVILINFGSAFLDSASNQQHFKNKAYFEKWLEDNKLKWDDPKAEEYREEYFSENTIFSDVAVVAAHIDHVVKLVGVDHVGFGSDFDGVGDSLPTSLKDVSFYPTLIYHLLKLNYTEEDISKICYKNFFRVWDEVEKVARSMQDNING
ncbi:dipeptidase [Candidatus Amoebophilus asiaticus]|nr:dipeptidase [Candidatus Amoebophilus asiaticus]